VGIGDCLHCFEIGVIAHMTGWAGWYSQLGSMNHGPPLLAGCRQARRSGGTDGFAVLRRSRGVETCSVAIMKAGEQPVVMVRWWNYAGIETPDLPVGG
jgi:hypothetical protein